MVLGKFDRDVRKMKLDHLPIPHKIINSKWIKDLNVRPKPKKILEEIISSNITDIACRKFLSDISPQRWETK